MKHFFKKITSAILLTAGIIFVTPASNSYADTITIASNYAQSNSFSGDSADAIFLRFRTGLQENIVVSRFVVKFGENTASNISAVLCKGNPSGTSYCDPSSLARTQDFSLSKSGSNKKITFNLPDGGKRLVKDSDYYLRISNPRNDIGLTSTSTSTGGKTGWEFKQARGLFSSTTAQGIAESGSNNKLYGIMRIEGYEITGAKITNIEITSTPDGANNTYTRGEKIKFQITSDSPLAESGNPDNTRSTFEFKLSASEFRYATLESIENNYSDTKVNFSYTVQEGDVDTNGIWIPADALQSPTYLRRTSGHSGYLSSKARFAFGSHPTHKVNGNSVIPIPSITNIYVSTRPKKALNTYLQDDEIRFTVDLDRDVKIEGTPTFQFNLGSGEANRRFATFDTGRSRGTQSDRYNSLVFKYTVKSTDSDDDGIWIPENPIILDGNDKAYDAERLNVEVPANLDYDQLGRQANHKIDGSITDTTPSISSIDIADSALAFKEHDTITINVTYTERVLVTGTPHIKLLIGPNDAETERKAYFSGISGTGNNIASFKYRIRRGDDDSDKFRVKLTPADETTPIIQLEAGESIVSESDAIAELWYEGTYEEGDIIKIAETSSPTIKVGFVEDEIIIHENEMATFRVAVTMPTGIACSGSRMSVGFNMIGPSTGTLSGTNGDLAWNDNTDILNADIPCSGGTFTINAPVNVAGEGIENVRIRMTAVDDYIEIDTDNVPYIITPEKSVLNVIIYEADYNISVDGGKPLSSLSFRYFENRPDTHKIRVSVRNSNGDLVPTSQDTQFKLSFQQTGEAETGHDYKSFPKDGIFTIPMGETGLTVDVPIIDDNDVEKYEHFDIRIETPAGPTQTGVTITRADHKVRLYSEEVLLIGMKQHDISITEGESAELCLVFKVTKERFVSAINDEVEDVYNTILSRGQTINDPKARVDFDFQVSMSPLKGTADIDDDYREFERRELDVSKGLVSGLKACKTFETINNPEPETDEEVEIAVERLPGLNRYGQIEYQITGRNGQPIVRQFKITIRDSSFVERFNVTANMVRPNKINVSWNQIRDATSFIVYHRQIPFGCKMGWVLDEHDPRGQRKEWKILGTPETADYVRTKIADDSINPWHNVEENLVCPYKFEKYDAVCSSGRCSTQIRSNAHSGGVIEQVNLFVTAYEPDENDPDLRVAIAHSKAIDIDPAQTLQAGCTYRKSNSRIPKYTVLTNPDGSPMVIDGRVQRTVEYEYVDTHTLNPNLPAEYCVGDVTVKSKGTTITLEWTRVQGAGVRSDGNGESEPPYYRVEYREAGQSTWETTEIRKNGEPKWFNSVTLYRVSHPITDLTPGKTYEVRIVTLGITETPTEIFTRKLEPAQNTEPIYQVKFTGTDEPDIYEIGEFDSPQLVCVTISRVDGNPLGPTDFPNFGTAERPDRKAVFRMNTADGTALVNEDYFQLSNKPEGEPITFTSRKISHCRAIFIQNDEKVEETEFLTVHLQYDGDPPPEMGAINSISARVNIIDDDGYVFDLIQKPKPADYTFGEDTVLEGSNQEFTVKLKKRKDTSTDLEFTLTEKVPAVLKWQSEGAREGNDFVIEKDNGGDSWTQIETPYKFEFPKGSTQDTGIKFRVNARNSNYEVELDEFVHLTVEPDIVVPVAYRPLTPDSSTITIKDNDVVEMKIEHQVYEHNEGDGTVTFNVILESANVNVDCLINFPVRFRIVNEPDTTDFKENPNEPLPPNDEKSRWELEDRDKRNTDLPYERTDGYYFERFVTFPACAKKVPVTWTINDDLYVERQTEQFFLSLHSVPGNPAGLRIGGRPRVDILDNDETNFGFAGEKDDAGITHYVPAGTTRVEVPYNLTKGVAFTFKVGIDAECKDSNNVACQGEVSLANTENFAGRNLTIHPYTHYGDGNNGTVLVDLPDNLEIGTVIKLTIDASLLRFQDSIKVPETTSVVKIKIGERPADAVIDRVNPELTGRILTVMPSDPQPINYCKLEVETVFKNTNDDSTVDVSDLQQSDFSIENGTIQGLTKDGDKWKLAARSNSGHTGLIRVKLNAKQDRWEEREQVFRATTSTSCQPASATELNSLVVTGHTLNEEFHHNTVSYTLETNNVNEITIEADSVYNTSTVEIIPGDSNTNEGGHQVALGNGENIIEVTVTTLYGNTEESDDTKTYTLTVTNNMPLLSTNNGALTGLEFVDIDSGGSTPLEHNSTMDTVSGKRYGIKANVDATATIGSVKFILTAPDGTTTEKIERLAPYSLWGDTTDEYGNRILNGIDPAIGSYTLSVYSYESNDATGSSNGVLYVEFSINKALPPAPPPAILGADLIDASDQSIIAEITQNMQVDLSGHYGKDVAIQVIATREDVESVVINLSGAKNVTATESLSPWSLYGDDTNGTLNGEALPPGSYTLNADAYSENGGNGTHLGSYSVSFEVMAQPLMSVADDEAAEGIDKYLEFVVSLTRASLATVTVEYNTADGTATAGNDYTAKNGTLTFAPGDLTKTVEVKVLDDSIDEGSENMKLLLSSATNIDVEDNEGIGTITNSDPIPKAYLARFGRTVTDQVVDAVQKRINSSKEIGIHATLAGESLPSFKTNRSDSEDSEQTVDEQYNEPELIHESIHDYESDQLEKKLEDATSSSEALLGTSFVMTGGSEEKGITSLWGNVSSSEFSGNEDGLSVNGEVTTGFFGTDWSFERGIAGLLIGYSTGEGGYSIGDECEINCEGDIHSSLTGLYPYTNLNLTERLSLWMTAGYGLGEVSVTPRDKSDMTTDISLKMGAVGVNNEILNHEHISLAIKGDARFTRISSEGLHSPNGNLEPTDSDVWMIRAGIEGSHDIMYGDSSTLTPSLELGIRKDGGDAETGIGADIGGGFTYSNIETGITFDGRVRSLVAHEDAEFKDWGASVTLGWDSRPSSESGFIMSLGHDWGEIAGDDESALMSQDTLPGFITEDGDIDEYSSANRLNGEIGYGIPILGGNFTGTPNAGFSISRNSNDYRVGWRLAAENTMVEVNLDATHRENTDTQSENDVMLRMSLKW